MPYKDLDKRRESGRASTARYRERHPDRIAAYSASNARKITAHKTYVKRKDKHRAYYRAYYATAKGRAARRTSSHDRRVRKLGFTSEDRDYVMVLLNDPCGFCGAETEHIDHIVPLAKGGEPGWTNLAATCASCNLSKATRSLLYWMSMA